MRHLPTYLSEMEKSRLELNVLAEITQVKFAGNQAKIDQFLLVLSLIKGLSGKLQRRVMNLALFNLRRLKHPQVF